MTNTNLEIYRRMMSEWVSMRDDQNVNERVKDHHLAEMDIIWYQLSEEEMRVVNNDE